MEPLTEIHMEIFEFINLSLVLLKLHFIFVIP